ncbi:hypothetical protein ACFL6X_08505 [Candidatus Latescibacterota bacterium]
MVSKARIAGALRIALIDAAGDKELQTIYEGPTPGGLDGLEGIAVREWVADVPPGDYRVRWTFDAEHRDFSITVK